MTCTNCGGERWVCENHSNMPWTGELNECCGGAGMPCPACNTASPPAMSPGSVTLWSVFEEEGDGTFEGLPVKGGVQ